MSRMRKPERLDLLFKFATPIKFHEIYILAQFQSFRCVYSIYQFIVKIDPFL